MPQAPLPINTFYNAEGEPLAFGQLLLGLNKDVLTPNGQICSQILMSVPLDANGSIPPDMTYWENASVSPNDSYYVLRAYTAAGQLALGPIKVFVSSGGSGFGTAFGLSFGS